MDVVWKRLREQAERNPDRLFLRSGPDDLTFGAMALRADAVAAGLASVGIARGDRVAILTPNRTEMLDLLFGCARLGAVQVPLNAYLKGEFLRYQLDDCQAQTLVVDEAGLAAAAPLLDRLPELRRIILLDEQSLESAVPQIPFSQIASCGDEPPAADLSADDLLSIVYTSGTTGLPKGCMLSNGYYLNVGRAQMQCWEVTAEDVILTGLPLFHGAARMMVVMCALESGACAVTEPAFSASGLLPRAIETKATILMGVGAMGVALLGQPPSPLDQAHGIRNAMWIPFPEAQQQQFEQRFGISTSGELYGQTECVPVTFTPANGPRNRASAGQPVDYLDVALLDENDNVVDVGDVGEIALRPKRANVMFKGYWRKPEATLDAFRTLWYHTGDYGRLDEGGFITFVDRKKDALRRRGENVSSVELEMAIITHPAILEAAVHAVPSEVTEDDIKVCLVLAPDGAVEPGELASFFKTNLPYYAVPRYVEVIDELPKNAMARVMKHLLRDRGVTPETWDLEALGLGVKRHERR